MKRSRYSLGPVIGYHGCDEAVAEKVLSGKTGLAQSANDYDWLGHGAYFWVDSPERALAWAKSQAENRAKRRHPKIKKPYVIGAVINPGLCSNLTDYGVMPSLKKAYQQLVRSSQAANTEITSNGVLIGGISMVRRLDSAVIETVHAMRRVADDETYDTVYGIFTEGVQAFSGSGFFDKTHVQIAVRNPECIVDAA